MRKKKKKHLVSLALAFLSNLYVESVAQAEGGMVFYVEPDPIKRQIAQIVGNGMDEIYASGEITEGTAGRFMDFLQKIK